MTEPTEESTVESGESLLVQHARQELFLCGQTDEDPEFAESLIAAVRGFSTYGHSGGSQSVAVHMLDRLLNFRPLSELTDNPAEWMLVADNPAMWQSRRSSAMFSNDAGKTYYDVDDSSGQIHNSKQVAHQESAEQ